MYFLIIFVMAACPDWLTDWLTHSLLLLICWSTIWVNHTDCCFCPNSITNPMTDFMTDLITNPMTDLMGDTTTDPMVDPVHCNEGPPTLTPYSGKFHTHPIFYILSFQCLSHFQYRCTAKCCTERQELILQVTEMSISVGILLSLDILRQEHWVRSKTTNRSVYSCFQKIWSVLGLLCFYLAAIFRQGTFM